MTDQLVDLEAEASLESYVNAVADEAAAAMKPTTGTQRKAALVAALDQGDIDHMMALQEKMTTAIDTILANKIDLDALGLLTPAELFDFMVEFLDQREIKELLEIRYKMLRAAVYAHLNEVHKNNGVADPEHTPGEVPVPKLGKKFVRRGGRAKAALDKVKLKAELGEDRWGQVCKAEIVPAVPEHIEYRLDEDALLGLVRQDPSVLEIFRKCVTPGSYGTPSFHVL